MSTEFKDLHKAYTESFHELHGARAMRNAVHEFLPAAGQQAAQRHIAQLDATCEAARLALDAYMARPYQVVAEVFTVSPVAA